MQKSAQEILKKYKELNRKENIDFLIKYVEENKNGFSRLNKEAHFTASGFVISNKKVLLIFHNKLQKFIQPGGHIENDDENLLGAAKREVEEETGLKVVPCREFKSIPVYIDIHKIPYNKNKNEPEHYHYDCMFAFELDGLNNVKLQEDEVSGYR